MAAGRWQGAAGGRRRPTRAASVGPTSLHRSKTVFWPLPLPSAARNLSSDRGGRGWPTRRCSDATCVESSARHGLLSPGAVTAWRSSEDSTSDRSRHALETGRRRPPYSNSAAGWRPRSVAVPILWASATWEGANKCLRVGGGPTVGCSYGESAARHSTPHGGITPSTSAHRWGC